jgi:hypothetical protein
MKVNKDGPHTYLNSKNEEIPSVTHIISIMNKKGINSWANMLGFKRISLRKFLDEKAIIGTLVHEKIENYFQKTEPKPFFDASIDKEVNKRLDLFKLWANEAQPEVIWEEKEFTNERYGGKIDLLARMYENEKIVLIDFKTSKSVHASQFLQLGGYLNLIQYNEPEMYERIELCQIVAINDKIHHGIRTKKEMLAYQEAFEDCYNLYIHWDKILKDHWNDSLKNLGVY